VSASNAACRGDPGLHCAWHVASHVGAPPTKGPRSATRAPIEARPVAEHLSVPWRIGDNVDRDEIKETLCTARFVDLAPAQIYATLLDDGVYMCSESTM